MRSRRREGAAAAAAARANKGSDSACASAWPAVAWSPAGVREIVAAAGTGRKAGQQVMPMSQGERGESPGGNWRCLEDGCCPQQLGARRGKKGPKLDGFLEKGMMQEITV